MSTRPAPGDLLVIDGAASVQFGGGRALTVRVVSVGNRPTYHGWLWLTVYVIDQASGEATDRRELFVQAAGLRPAPALPPPGQRSGRTRAYARRHDRGDGGTAGRSARMSARPGAR